ncbi:hypothetical protein [Desulfovibrio piger]|uniref:hypothetical protein n=1 Tax=Desulfovibrio piger TaxID=901 RepID=UPI003A926771
MHRIDHETATSDHKFTEGNPTIPVPATVVTDDWLNAVQEELVAVITGAGLELEKSDNTQLWQAITTAVDNARPGLATTKNPGLVQIGDGLAITPEGLLSVLIASTSQAGLVKPRYGLKIGEDGSLDVDFGDMPTDKFEELLKSIRVPIWVERTKKFYVDKSTGSDTLDDGRGESESKPFKTIQACVDYVTSNYNLNKNNVGIYIAPGVYEESLTLGSFSRTTGYIALIDKEGNYGVTIRMTNANVIRVEGGEWVLRGIIVESQVTAFDDGLAHFIGSIVSAGGMVHLEGCDILQEYTGPAPTNGSVYMRMLGAYGAGAVIQIESTSRARNHLRFHRGNASSMTVLFAERGGAIQCVGSNFAPDYVTIRCEGEASDFMYLNNSKFYNIGGTINMARFATVENRTVTGRRYYLISNSLCSTGGQGAEFFPGDTAGSLENSTYCVYK